MERRSKLKVYDVMQVSRVRQGTKKEKPVWSKYDGPFQSSIEAKDTMDDLNRDVKSTTYHTKTYPQKRTQISYQVLKRNATAEEIQDIEDEENEFQAEILEAELEDKKAAAIVKPKEKKKKQKNLFDEKKKVRTFLTIQPQLKEGEKCPETQTPY